MKNKAVFLDRDGVINRDILDYTWRVRDFVFLDGIFEASRQLQEKGYILIVITNQGGIAKGLYSHEDVNALHELMTRKFSEHGIVLTEIYYCPHHDVAGKCICRKPGSLLVEKAVARFEIDPARSFFIGDRDRDVMAGEGAGVKGILVDVNDDLRKVIGRIP